MLSKALVVGAYQKKAEELAALPGIELTVAVPPVWREPGVGDQVLERRFVRGYQLAVLPIWLNGRHHVHFYPAIERLLAQVRPDVFHIDEESFNFATDAGFRIGAHIQGIAPGACLDNGEPTGDTTCTSGKVFGVALTRQPDAVPEPATLILVATGLGSLFAIRRTRSR